MGEPFDWNDWVKDFLGIDPALFGSPSDVQEKPLPDVKIPPPKKKDPLTPDYEQDGRGSPYHQTVPDPAPPDPLAPTILKTPQLPLDISHTRPAPKKPPPDVPLAADSKAVAAVIAGIDDHALVPKGGAAGDYPSAHEVARALADQIDSDRLAKHSRSDFKLNTPYPTPEANKAALDQVAEMARKIAAALPEKGAPVVEVGIDNLPPAGHKKGGWGMTVRLTE